MFYADSNGGIFVLLRWVNPEIKSLSSHPTYMSGDTNVRPERVLNSLSEMAHLFKQKYLEDITDRKTVYTWRTNDTNHHRTNETKD